MTFDRCLELLDLKNRIEDLQDEAVFRVLFPDLAAGDDSPAS